MSATSEALVKWDLLHPRYQSMFFHLGPREIVRRTGLSPGTLYNCYGKTCTPDRRTVRDIQRAVEEWEKAEDERDAG